jgi:hypothetical protein
MLGLAGCDIWEKKYSIATRRNEKAKFFGVTLSQKNTNLRDPNKNISYFVHNVIRVSLKALMATILSYFAFRNWDKIGDHTGLDKAMFRAGLTTGAGMALFYAGTRP